MTPLQPMPIPRTAGVHAARGPSGQNRAEPQVSAAKAGESSPAVPASRFTERGFDCSGANVDANRNCLVEKERLACLGSQSL